MVDENVAEFLKRQEPCLVLQSGLGPEDLSWAPGMPMGDHFGCIVDPGYARGCALRFLFRPGLHWLRARDTERPYQCHGRLPLPHVGVHIRLGDDFLRPGGEALNLSKSDQQLVHKVLVCAQSLGTELFGPRRGDEKRTWRIVLAADSTKAKLFAIEEAKALGIDLTCTPVKPVHSDLGGRIAEECTIHCPHQER